MRTAYLSPFPPVASGVSEYSAELLPELAKLLPVRAFGETPARGRYGGVEVEPKRAFDRDAAEFDLAVYHMGNNMHHHFVHERARRIPGLVVLHDLILHHFYAEAIKAPAYSRLMAEVYGERGAGVATANVHGVSSELAFFLYPLFEPLLAGSRGVLVHNRRAADEIARRLPGLPVACVPMGIPEPATDPLPDRAEARRALGIGADEMVVGMFGFVTPMKRPSVVLRAYAAARPRLPRSRLAIVGSVSSGLDLAAETRALGIAPHVSLTGYLPYAEVKRWAAAADVFVNLRYPTAGETSASLLRLLSWQKLVIVSAYRQFREFPEDVALRVPLGLAEQAELEELLVLLARRPDIGRRFGEQAARFVAEQHTLAAAARLSAEFFREVAARPVPAPREREFVAAAIRRTSRTPRQPRARLAAGALAETLRAGERVELEVRAENKGDTSWLSGTPMPGVVVLGGYLRDRDGHVVARLADAVLPHDVEPGGTAVVRWRLDVPAVAGHFELVAGLRIPGWGWLHARGSEALVWDVRIAA